jgi:hypothetical protein
MTRGTTLLSTQRFTTARREWRISMALVAGMMVLPALAHAHGGMGADEVGPPIFTSGIIGFVCYWLVILWPSAKKNDVQGGEASAQNSSAPRTASRSHKRPARVRRVPRLRKIEGSGRFGSDQNARRKASDG